MTGLYLHIPFCRRKCPYCDFYSVPANLSQREEYPDLLRQHLTWSITQGWVGPAETIYFGGGTPSLLSPQAVAEILQEIEQRFGIAPDAEITLEANPGTVTLESLTGYRAAGINRLSLGLQTLEPKQLNQLGRLHSCQDGLEACHQARQAGFQNLSLDLMFALPGQTLPELQQEIEAYLALNPEHLSCYGLTAEPGTPFETEVETGQLTLPDDETYAEAFLLVDEQLTRAGYQHYEIANYARDGFASQHNLGYWQRRPYLGLGAGAHSFNAQNWGSRWAVPADLGSFQQALSNQKDPAQLLEQFDRDGALRETIYLLLRTRSGVCDSELQKQFGVSLSEAFPQAVGQLSKWLIHSEDRWSFTPAGWLLFDRLIQAFL